MLQWVAFRGSYASALKRVQFQQGRFNAVTVVLDTFGLNGKHTMMGEEKNLCRKVKTWNGKYIYLTSLSKLEYIA